MKPLFINKNVALFLLTVFISLRASAQVTSNFSSDDEGWTVFDNGSGTTSSVTYNSIGGNPSGNISYSTASTFASRYYFQAPAKFLGNLSSSYNQALTFDLMVSLTGTDNNASDVMFVSSSLTLVYQLTTKPANANTWIPFSIPFNETDPSWHVSNQTGAAPTKDQMKQMLSNITSIKIRMKFTTANTGTFTGSIDNVTMNTQAIITPPVITAVSPLLGVPNSTIITITGNNFNPTSSQNIVFFGGVKTNVTSASATSITVKVPMGAQFGRIRVLDLSTGRSAESAQVFSPQYNNNQDYGGRIIPSSLAPKVNIDIAPGNTVMATFSVGDIDGDGWNDLVIPEMGNNRVSIFQNLQVTGSISTSSFGAKQSIMLATGGKGNTVLIDFDGDGKLDIATGTNNGSVARIALLLNTSVPGTISFASPQYMQASSYADGPIHAADIDGDGRPEILSTFDNSSGGAGAYFTIFQNLSTPGDIEFAAYQDFDFGILQQSGAISTGDLNGDGKLDAVVVNSFDSQFAIFQNTSTPGNISFNSPFEMNIGGSAKNVAIADLDSDGKLDLAWCGYNTNSVLISKNIFTSGSLSTASFASPITLTSPLGYIQEKVAVGDINSDSRPDIILAGSTDIAIFENKSVTGTLDVNSFIYGTPFQGNNPTYGYYIGPVVSDLDADGKLDVIVSETSSPTSTLHVSIYHNECYPAPKITSITPPSTSAGNTITITGDLFQTGTVAPSIITHDGILKTTTSASSNTNTTAVIPTGSKSDNVSVTVHGLTSNTTTLPITFPTNHVINTTSFGTGIDFALNSNTNNNIAIADWDDDDKPDVGVVDNYHTGKIFQNTHAVAGQSITTSSLTQLATTFSTYSALTSFDIDGDGKLDISSGYGFFQNASSNGTISFPTAPNGTNITTSFTVAATADFNKDGKIDLATIGSSAVIGIYENRSTNGSFSNLSYLSTFPTTSVNLTRTSTYGSIATADFDGDGNIDIATADDQSGTNEFAYYRNLGVSGTITSASFASGVTVATGLQPYGIAVADYDGDGKPDVAITHYNAANSYVSVFQNTSIPGTINFAAAVNFNCVKNGYDMAAQDLDGDGKPEMIVIHQPSPGPGSFSIFQNTSTSGSISFATVVNYPITHSPQELAIADMNQDNKPDILIVGYGTNALSVYENKMATPVITISTQPTSSYSVCDGDTSTISTNATGTTNITYQWQEYVPDGGGYGDLNDNMFGISNSSTSALTINTGEMPNVTSKFGTTIYRCKISGDFAPTIYTNTVSYTINQLPSTPTAQDASNCGQGSVTLNASGGSNGNYIWYDDNGVIIGENNSSYSTPVISTTTPYSVAVTNGTCVSQKTNVNAIINSLPNAPTTQGANACANNQFTLSASGATDGQYRWYTAQTGGTAIADEVSSTYTTPALSTTTTYYVSINNGACESSRTAVTAYVLSNGCNPPTINTTLLATQIGGEITLNLVPLIITSNNNLDLSSLQITVPPSSGATASIDANGILTIDYIGLSFAGNDRITIKACDLNNNCAEQQFSITVSGDIEVFNGISPNGVNPKLIIQNIEILPDTKINTVSIYDRWENLVWQGNDYDNSSVVFTGTSNSGSALPSGVYFYKIAFASGRSSKTGFIALRRQ